MSHKESATESEIKYHTCQVSISPSLICGGETLPEGGQGLQLMCLNLTTFG